MRWTARAVVLAFLVSATALFGQQLEDKVMTKEEVLAALKGASPLKADVMLDGAALCSFDTRAGTNVVGPGSGFPVPATPAQTNTRPKLLVKLSPGDDAKRLLLVKEGAIGTPVQIAWVSLPNDQQHHALALDKPVEPGRYTLAVRMGQLVSVLRCSFTVK